jgi:DNA (cytosine-5)-methyltransferase 1
VKKALDLFCGAGGASMGLHLAGFEVTGVDLKPQPRYPFKFHQAEALTFPLEGFDLIWASPPCQEYSNTKKIRNNKHPDLIQRMRTKLKMSGIPYIIENVVGAPLVNPITLCGLYFNLETYRHRIFETSFPVKEPPHREHIFPTAKMGRPPKAGEFIHVVGNFSNVNLARAAMGIPWMSRTELSQAIPPAYSHYIASQL